MNIVWKKPDGTVAVTHVTEEAESLLAEAQKLRARGDIPSDWELVATNVILPDDKVFRGAWTWTTPELIMDIDLGRAREITKDRLRAERAPLLAALDTQFIRAQETGADTSGIVAAKQRLRDVTKRVDEVRILSVLRAMSCENLTNSEGGVA